MKISSAIKRHVELISLLVIVIAVVSYIGTVVWAWNEFHANAPDVPDHVDRDIWLTGYGRVMLYVAVVDVVAVIGFFVARTLMLRQPLKKVAALFQLVCLLVGIKFPTARAQLAQVLKNELRATWE